MDRLEKGSGNTVLSEREAQALLKDDEDLVMAVYDYWLAKRLRLVSLLTTISYTCTVKPPNDGCPLSKVILYGVCIEGNF